MFDNNICIPWKDFILYFPNSGSLDYSCIAEYKNQLRIQVGFDSSLSYSTFGTSSIVLDLLHKDNELKLRMFLNKIKRLIIIHARGKFTDLDFVNAVDIVNEGFSVDEAITTILEVI